MSYNLVYCIYSVYLVLMKYRWIILMELLNCEKLSDTNNWMLSSEQTSLHSIWRYDLVDSCVCNHSQNNKCTYVNS